MISQIRAMVERVRGIWTWLDIKITGAHYVGMATRDGWKAPMPFYAFECPKHGIQVSHPHGYGMELRCPVCLEALKAYTEEASG
jgi:hypothetical protein